ncbi:class I SAM-dependent methyltransferase [Aquabacterium sp.]|uniref:class I SAM-dependent methyltransferase n=1 Tax=Aquabacterium sp. TaxID=1872578 RepID=UPI002C74BFB6|nr:class I SAM-dependent methyltransferase [Aquabacterium sp.]HSW07428.1 class I SAM-dependent methyltransferase [Aquabacterium sp.]
MVSPPNSAATDTDVAATEVPHRPTKGDIINRLIRQHRLERYLEYNKFDGATYYGEIVCAHKERAYQPERSYLDAGNLRRLLDVAKDAEIDAILPLDRLLERYQGERFDLIFFDPVHVRPDVDQALQLLPRLLRPGGFLVVHDCNPGLFSQTTLQRKPDAWVGETYKAFAVFRAHNRERAITVDEDFGVGLVWNIDLNLDYAIDHDIDYFHFAERREDYIGLIGYDEFLARTAEGDAARLFAQPPPTSAVHLLPRRPGGDSGATVTLPGPAALSPQAASGARWASSQLFWRGAGADFAERESCELPICFDGRRQLLSFVLSDLGSGGVAGLRFDFADCCGLARLDSMHLTDSQHRTLWTWDGRHDVLQATRNLRFVSDAASPGELLMLATSSDPSFELALPSDTWAAVRAGARWVVQLTPLPDFMHAVVVAMDARHAALQARLDAVTSRVDALQAELAAAREALSPAAAAPAAATPSCAR